MRVGHVYTTQASMKLFDSEQHGEQAELFLVEGDSAARSVANLRDLRTQAVLPLQGKPLNAWKASAARVEASPLYRQLADALGTRSAIDPTPLPANGPRFGRLLLLFDPDADGVHICALLLLYLQRWMPGWLAQGRVLVVRAPMFSVSHPDHGTAYAWSPEHAQAILRDWQADGALHRYLGLGSLPPEVLRRLCVDPATRQSRTAGDEDIALVRQAFGLDAHAD